MSIALQRLYQQRISHNPLASPREVVAWLGAVQSQDYPGAKWSLGQRSMAATDESVERAFNAGAILRTHLMRPTWHFVTPEDIRWLVELTGPRINAGNAGRYQQLGLDKTTLSQSCEVVARALEGGRQLTRAQLGVALESAGISTEGQRLSHILMHTELVALTCSGPRAGKQFTYMLLEERAPDARRLPREEALAELTRRYFTGHGPATVRDFTWWSGMTVADAKTGLALNASHLANAEINGQTHWFSETRPPRAEPSPAAFLLPTYDEFLIGYSAFDRSRKVSGETVNVLKYESTVVHAGKIIATWRRAFQRSMVVVEIAPFNPLNEDEKKAVEAAVERFGAFLEMPSKVQWG